jgi:hypothetical protein
MTTLTTPIATTEAAPPRHPMARQSPAIAQLTLTELDDRILAIRRLAARQHVSQAEWKTVDRMRKRAEALRKQQFVR